jgi:hypothetical protein
MNLNYIELLPEDFSDQSRVWIYQSNRLFTLSEALKLEEIIDDFIKNWNSHGTPVKGFGNLLFGQFIILMADEKNTTVSGCSTDSSVRLIKVIEEVFKVSMFDRTQLAFILKEKIQLLPLSQVPYALEHKFIDAETLFFDHSVSNKKELTERWIVSLSNSWLGKRYLVNF